MEASQEVANIERLKTALLIWKSEIDAVLDQEFPNYTPEVMTSAAAGTARWQEAAQRTASSRSFAMPGRI